MLISVSAVIRVRPSYVTSARKAPAPQEIPKKSLPAVLQSLSGEYLPAGIFGRVNL